MRDTISENEKSKIESIFPQRYKVIYLDHRDKSKRNGIIWIKIQHESNTLPNGFIRQMLEIGFVVSCVVGSLSENGENNIYFKRLKGSF